MVICDMKVGARKEAFGGGIRLNQAPGNSYHEVISLSLGLEDRALSTSALPVFINLSLMKNKFFSVCVRVPWNCTLFLSELEMWIFCRVQYEAVK